MYLLDRFVKARLAVHRFRIGEHVNEEKYAQRNDARDLVKLLQKKGVREFNRHLEKVGYPIGILLT